MSRMPMWTATLAASLLLASGPALAAAPPAPDYAAVDRYVQSQVDANHFPGVAFAIVEGEALAHGQGFGHDAQGQPVTPQTPFMIGSNSKSFTALAVMQLVEAGLVELDAPVQRYLPAFHVADAEASRLISVRHLLNQTSGLPGTAAGDTLLEFQPASFQETLVALGDVRLHAPPGSAYAYANANYFLLGLVIEAAARQPYATYVQGHIFDPLQMTHSRLDSGDAVGYSYWFGLPVAAPMPYTSDYASVPTGGVVSTAEDMGRYLAMYLNGGQYAGRRLLSSAGIADMERGVSRVTFAEGDRTITLDYGMGWATGDIAGVPAVYHTGGSPQFSSWMVLVPSENRALITLTNANNWIPGPGVSSTELIPKGVLELLEGAAPDQGTSLSSMYLVVDAVAVSIVLAMAWSLARVLRRPMHVRRHPSGPKQAVAQTLQVAVPLLWELGLAAALMVGFPRLFEVASWAHVMAYTPDLGSLAALVSVLWVVTGGTRLARALGALRAEAAVASGRSRPAGPRRLAQQRG